jgi:ribosome-associated protein YbcJ (S4-like RNA binding protein)
MVKLKLSGKKLVTGDRVTVGNETFTVNLDNP